jgi:hypothetical protein
MPFAVAEILSGIHPLKMKTSELIDAVSFLKGLLSTHESDKLIHESDKLIVREKIRDIDAEIDRRVPIPAA